MLETAGKYLTVYLSSMLKFIAGPVTGLATGLSLWETALFTACGMMSVVVLLTFVGPVFRAWIRHRLIRKGKLFSTRNRRFVKIWKRWGIFGVSFLTPLLLTPIGGALLVNAFSGDRQKIVIYMLISSVFWGFALSGLVFVGWKVLPG